MSDFSLLRSHQTAEDIRDEWLPKRDALTLFTLMSTILTRRQAPSDPQLLLCFDEAHRYMEHRPLRAEIERLCRERRHLGLSLLLASQDPMGIPMSLLGLMDMVALGKVQSDEWLRRLGKANTVFRALDAKLTSGLGGGKMLLWSERMFTEGIERKELLPILPVRIRPQSGHHGGATRTAVR